ncbi:DUF3368 domain-containing protein [Candidatus Woesearchaeota archaeon]|nr:DUF3368 domain-containing protein [Candidatus Woesearchaeota archaeon]
MIVNASPLIIFGKLNRIDILKNLYKKIEITNEVYREVVLKGVEQNLRDALVVKEHIDDKNINIFTLAPKFFDTASRIQLIYNIDIGEAETIALALQLNKKEIIIDEIAAREAAKAFGIKTIGSLRVLLIAYREGLIDKEEINNFINEMENSKYRFSTKVLLEFWDLLGKIKKK